MEKWLVGIYTVKMFSEKKSNVIIAILLQFEVVIVMNFLMYLVSFLGRKYP